MPKSAYRAINAQNFKFRFLAAFLTLSGISWGQLPTDGDESDKHLVITWAVRGTPQGVSEQDSRDAAMWAVTSWSQALLVGIPIDVEERPWEQADIRIAWDDGPTAPTGGIAIWPPLSLWPYDSTRPGQLGDWTVDINRVSTVQPRPKSAVCYLPGPMWRGILLHEVGHNFGCSDHSDTKTDSPCGTMRSGSPWLSDEDRAELNAVWANGQAVVHNPPPPTFPLVGRVVAIDAPSAQPAGSSR
jgi:hypothetical protein